ncbi:glycoside hydrolase family 5 protein [Sphingomonas naphthae]|uniref:Glycoside hydrolase family 5 protein n=1 Tax=Sphingomonas naphthae TaxID=1813468 RepID=A0ABY7TKB7_9SPHN|nr:glycoside hydrolase family 5 protein [Sphingomonas naphthae]WCT73226.1 glycoside hydrolase family 5 protein [Sphingomonas naphthae]
MYHDPHFPMIERRRPAAAPFVPPPAPRRRRARWAALGLALALAAGGAGAWQAFSKDKVAVPHGAPVYWGVNLAGGEFAPDDDNAEYGKNYIYPDAKIAAPFVAAGMNVVRLPLRWERIQPWPQAMLSPIESKRLDETLDGLSDVPLVILDIHNFGAFHKEPLRADAKSADMLADLWRRLALRYKDRPNIAFGLMNEPVDMDAREWRQLADSTVAAIRGTGARNLILVPGVSWTGAHSWMQGGAGSNAEAMKGFRDPGGNFAIEMHQYLDGDSGGHGADCVDRRVAIDRMRDATDWLRENHYRGFLGEFATGSSAQCLDSLDGLMGFLNTNGDVWMGWTWWAAGPWWGDAWNNIQPDDKTGDRPQMAVLRRYIGGRPDTAAPAPESAR